ncbi:Methionyl-tRNA formyltransferase, mitochondrial [Madurella mycetomatis]|uniref:methionyl-tRNA formyltransferase n=1 Tax=Madurella mycetomatis TaxID=100816 RepID=A0A175WHQ0_9PEZI|nr:Methionyl-tRNA formyltransferase, mitochondrial [Madurella mycetomatis]KXX83105.1 Methionyl-tRNA formyltransferase, mitochondrial [Madurella mycetomatis]
MMLRVLTRSVLRSRARSAQQLASYSTVLKLSDPLRILFCGSDEFSCFSLRALHEEHKRNADLIRSIDVVVRPSKPTGRGYKVLREVPLRTLADKLGLPVHVRDTFTGWDMPQPDGAQINLIIAVSFGLFVPPRLLNLSRYGGLNVHPSLLPDLRGPAPLHHALLNRDSHTGISIQTLSPQAFDAGAILLQTPRPGMPIPPNCTVAQLHDTLAPQGAAMLVEVLRRGLHIPPYPDQRPYHHHRDSVDGEKLRHAPKITSDDRQVCWRGAAGARDVALRERVLGPLWTHILVPDRRSGSGSGGEKMVEKRAILEELSEAGDVQPIEGGTRQRNVIWMQVPGRKEVASGKEEIRAEYYVSGDGVVVRMPDESWLKIGRIKLEGSASKPARQVLESTCPR